MRTFEQDVKAYGNYASKFDTPIRQVLANGDPRDAIRRIAGAYRVARNFPRRFDEALGIDRYEPVVRALVAHSPNTGINPVEVVLQLAADLEQIYHRKVLSASSKFLWFAWGREIIIYDSQSTGHSSDPFSQPSAQRLSCLLCSLEGFLFPMLPRDSD
jgi:hypothetical protein